ncbi:unnamed protein product [Notodromas monacha]|uniref:Uncharacterized protein n=1 Tax=Notodromas monacha TaxID=399045 RepID=A0A7R9GE49_9CRUS|nr:unnamed protein product [Notodromas monacha]CAG0919388.1 unnamed protein product [Notodromas monacha]
MNRVIYVLWMAYASTYLLRKPVTLIKSDILASGQASSPTLLSLLDAAFLVPYACVQFIADAVIDARGAWKVLQWSCGLASASGMVLVLVARSAMDRGALWALVAAQAASAGCVSLAWPAVCRIVSKGGAGGGTRDDGVQNAFRFLGTSAYVGAFAATFVAVRVREWFGWWNVFPICSALCFVATLMCWTVARVDDGTNLDVKKKGKEEDFRKKTGNSMALTLVAYGSFFTKMRFAVYLWLPSCLHHTLGLDAETAGALSATVEAGGAVGAWLLGNTGDSALRTCSLCSLAAGGAISLLAAAAAGAAPGGDPLVVAVLVAAFGVLNSGVDAVLSGAVAADVGAVGFVNGVGFLGAVAEAPVMALVMSVWEWNGFFACVAGAAVMAAVALWRAHVVVSSEAPAAAAVMRSSHK